MTKRSTWSWSDVEREHGAKPAAGVPAAETQKPAPDGSYIRSTDGLRMVRVAPHQFINEKSLLALGLVRQ